MKIDTEELRKSLKELYAGTAYSYVGVYLDKANHRWLEAFQKVTGQLNMEKVARIRYMDQSKKHFLDALIRSFEAEEATKNLKAEVGRQRHLRRFRNLSK